MDELDASGPLVPAPPGWAIYCLMACRVVLTEEAQAEFVKLPATMQARACAACRPTGAGTRRSRPGSARRYGLGNGGAARLASEIELSGHARGGRASGRQPALVGDRSASTDSAVVTNSSSASIVGREGTVSGRPGSSSREDRYAAIGLPQRNANPTSLAVPGPPGKAMMTSTVSTLMWLRDRGSVAERAAERKLRAHGDLHPRVGIALLRLGAHRDAAPGQPRRRRSHRLRPRPRGGLARRQLQLGPSTVQGKSAGSLPSCSSVRQ